MRDLKSNPLHLKVVITTLFYRWRFLSGILIEGGRGEESLKFSRLNFQSYHVWWWPHLSKNQTLSLKMKNWYVFFGLQLNFHGNKPSMTLLVATCPIVSHDSSTPFFSAIINSPLSLLIPGFSTTPSRINSSSSLSFLPVQCHSHPLNASQSQKDQSKLWRISSSKKKKKKLWRIPVTAGWGFKDIRIPTSYWFSQILLPHF